MNLMFAFALAATPAAASIYLPKPFRVYARGFSAFVCLILIGYTIGMNT